MWGGRFSGEIDPLMTAFNDSIGYDIRMWREDIIGSKAYARALVRAKVLTDAECDSIIKGLDQVYQEFEDDKITLVPSDEDVHTLVERRMTEIIGADIGGKLHTGRSRNDQVATDVRLWLRNEVALLRGHVKELLTLTADRAEKEVDILMPGYTHLQRAQPIRWSHWLLAHAASWQRDAERLGELAQRVNVMPLGCGALAGHPFGIDRDLLADDLGFDRLSTNSMDAVSDRDFATEFLFVGSMLQNHLSRFAEDMIIFSTAEFGFVTCSDAYSTGSSLMPQKKNPDALELLRGKTGRITGNLMALLTITKGVPMTYNKDFQEDKERLFDGVDTIGACVQIASGVVSTMTPHPEKMFQALSVDMLATDLADYLVRRGVPFRETHHIAGAAVMLAEDTDRRLDELTLAELQSLNPAFEQDVMSVWDFESSVENRNTKGGTSRSAVLEQVSTLREAIDQM